MRLSERQKFEYRGETRQGMTEWLERDIIITGERVECGYSFDQNGQPNVQITLDGVCGMLMSRATRANVKRRMGVLFIERKFRTLMTSTKMARPLLFVSPTTRRRC